MPVTPAYYTKTIERLNQVRPIRARKMFGGAGIYHREVFFGILDDDQLFFKVDVETIPEYDQAGMGPWICAGEVMNSYREVPSEVLSEDILGDWIDRSVEAAVRLKKGKK